MPKKNFGKAFPDELKKVSFSFGHFSKKIQGGKLEDTLIGLEPEEEPSNLLSPWRKMFFSLITILAFSILFGRLFHLQIINGAENRDRADYNRIQVRVIHAPRGVIYDREGKLLAQNEPGFRLMDATNPESKKSARSISREEAIKMEISNDPRYQNLEVDSIRSYPLSEKTAHILGYVSEITEEELKDIIYKDYKLGDKIGRGGIEEAYEKVLKGVDGGEIIEVDAQGKKIRTLRETSPIAGQNVYLSIDARLQVISYDRLNETVLKTGACCGALIAQEPKTGQILALVSLPSFDPKKISEALVAPNSPLLNRAIAGAYPPGSTFKMVSAYAGLSSGKITPSTIFNDEGMVRLGTFTFSNWYFTQYGRTEGPVDIVKALKRSNDTYFYRLAQLVGEKTLGEIATKFGFGKQIGIDIPGETSGLVPNDEWKQKNINEVWYPGDTLHMVIGQGFLLTTPLQISNLSATIASNGKQFPPHLASKITDPKGNVIKEFNFESLDRSLDPNFLKLIKTGMEQVPKSGGTAWPFFNFPFSTAGKTGTAEFGDPKNKTHAWYTAYAPVEDPKIEITVLIEAGGEGSTNASPVAKEALRWYLSPDKNNLVKDVIPIATESARTLGE